MALHPTIAPEDDRSEQVAVPWSGPVATPGIEYEPCIVTFIDVLGFRSLIANRTAGEVHAILHMLRDVTRPEVEPAPSRMSEVRLRSQAFAEVVSDAVVRVRVYDTQQRDGALFWELLDLLHAQLDCIGRGVVVRAGITIGEAHVGINGEGPVFGPAFVRAYDIESRDAVYPRIVLDLPAYEAVRHDERLRSEHHEADDELGYLDDLLTVDEDGWLFLDYLRAGEAEFDEVGDYFALLAAHERLIRRGLEAAGDNECLRNKYVWMRRYHNGWIEGMLSELAGGTRDSNSFVEEYGVWPDALLRQSLIAE
ncbi:hypothetical protein BV97_05667 [Novosphingobium resinovorum]|uniref:Guanylate cyclase domain-containing protein n=1 Tax=Novosphingobium resinovorum TaxID=158500 RepID=A0A031J447_9SPHN|nr:MULTISPECIES: hypothetical protein [Novosphingobium]EZP68026.1 hypothetical protein BV97_05667 [Novosphingobium resinovorum]